MSMEPKKMFQVQCSEDSIPIGNNGSHVKSKASLSVNNLARLFALMRLEDQCEKDDDPNANFTIPFICFYEPEGGQPLDQKYFLELCENYFKTENSFVCGVRHVFCTEAGKLIDMEAVRRAIQARVHGFNIVVTHGYAKVDGLRCKEYNDNMKEITQTRGRPRIWESVTTDDLDYGGIKFAEKKEVPQREELWDCWDDVIREMEEELFPDMDIDWETITAEIEAINAKKEAEKAYPPLPKLFSQCSIHDCEFPCQSCNNFMGAPNWKLDIEKEEHNKDFNF